MRLIFLKQDARQKRVKFPYFLFLTFWVCSVLGCSVETSEEGGQSKFAESGGVGVAVYQGTVGNLQLQATTGATHQILSTGGALTNAGGTSALGNVAAGSSQSAMSGMVSKTLSTLPAFTYVAMLGYYVDQIPSGDYLRQQNAATLSYFDMELIRLWESLATHEGQGVVPVRAYLEGQKGFHDMTMPVSGKTWNDPTLRKTLELQFNSLLRSSCHLGPDGTWDVNASRFSLAHPCVTAKLVMEPDARVEEIYVDGSASTSPVAVTNLPWRTDWPMPLILDERTGLYLGRDQFRTNAQADAERDARRRQAENDARRKCISPNAIPQGIFPSYPNEKIIKTHLYAHASKEINHTFAIGTGSVWKGYKFEGQLGLKNLFGQKTYVSTFECTSETTGTVNVQVKAHCGATTGPESARTRPCSFEIAPL